MLLGNLVLVLLLCIWKERKGYLVKPYSLQHRAPNFMFKIR